MKCLKIDFDELMIWRSTISDKMFIVKKDGIVQAKLNSNNAGNGTLKEVFKFNDPIVSAWFDSSDTSLAVLSQSQLTLIDATNWIVKNTFELEKSLTGILSHGDHVVNDDAWVCGVVGYWLQDHTGNNGVLHRLQHVVSVKNVIIVVDMMRLKYWTKIQSPQSRGQFLSQFISKMLPSVRVSSLSSTISLLPQSLKCQFLHSALKDLQFNQDAVVLLTSSGDVWKISRDDQELIQTCLLKHSSSICLNQHLLTVVTQDGAVYKFNLKNKEVLQNNPSPFTADTGFDVGQSIKKQAEHLEKLGNNSYELESKLKQLQLYQYLHKSTEENISKLMSFSSTVDGVRNIIQCQLKILSANIQLQGKFWNLKVELFSKSGKCIQSSTVSLADLFTSYSEPAVLNLFLDSKTFPKKVTGYLSFKSNLIKSSNSNVKLLPLIPVGCQEIEILKFMYKKGENISNILTKTDFDLFSSTLSDFSRNPKRISCIVNSENLSSKIGEYICESVKKEISLVILEREVRLKSEIHKRTKEMSTTFECLDQTVLDLLVSMLHQDNSIVRII